MPSWFGKGKSKRDDSPEEYADTEEKHYDCRNCGRSFRKDALKRHEPVCHGSQSSKRKVFDSGKQRAIDSDIPLSAVRTRQKDFVKRGGHYSPPRTNWKSKSEAVRSVAKVPKSINSRSRSPSPRGKKGGKNGGKGAERDSSGDSRRGRSTSKSKGGGSKSKSASKSGSKKGKAKGGRSGSSKASKSRGSSKKR